MTDILLNNIVLVIVTAALAYCIGSINPAIIITKMALHKDIRSMGSGNAGFTNVLRTVGKGPAVMTIVFDFLKGVFAAAIGGVIFAQFSQDPVASAVVSQYGAYLGGLFVVIGHMFPVFFKFKGGKGVTTAAAVMLATDVRVFFMILLTFGIGFIATRIISVASLISAFTYPIYTFIFLFISYKNPTEGAIALTLEYVIVCTVFAAVISLLVIIKHHSNIGRIIKGTEKKIEPKSRKKPSKPKGRTIDPDDIHK